MQAPLYVTPSMPVAPPPEAHGTFPTEIGELLRQILDVQREQVALLRALVAAQDASAKWRGFLAKWSAEYPEIGGACKKVAPELERAFLNMLRELSERVRSDDSADLTDDFVLNEFLDRYGTRLSQLATVMTNVVPLGDAAPPHPPTT
jgi:hypothetical protein